MRIRLDLFGVKLEFAFIEFLGGIGFVAWLWFGLRYVVIVATPEYGVEVYPICAVPTFDVSRRRCL